MLRTSQTAPKGEWVNKSPTDIKITITILARINMIMMDLGNPINQ